MPFPDIATVDHQRSPLERSVLRLQQLTDCSETVTLITGRGAVVDLTDADHVVLTVKDAVNAMSNYLQTTVEVVSPTEGVVRVVLGGGDLDVAGVFLTEYAVYQGTSGHPYQRIPGFMDVTQSLATANQVVGVHIEDLRSALYDRSAEDNFLLNDVEFTDEQICWALLKTVGVYNETAPRIGTVYSAVDFPYRERWIDGAVGHLLLIAARNYARNDLSYQSGGTSINDKNKAALYLQLGTAAVEDYKAWSKELKIEQNMLDAISGSVAWGFSDYG